ncbi:MAG: SDR family NAD(P)-dependent oxidoreductase [Acidobacteriaceae bacterium]
MGKISLKNRIVFITGASAGIGAACARAFAAEGAQLLLAARRLERLEAMEVDLLEAGAPAVHAFRLDVQNRAAVERAIAELPDEWRAIDVLVNNAGLSRGLDKLWEGKPQDWEEMIDTNIKGLLWVTRAVVPGMVARGRGHVVNLGSTAQEIAYPGGSVYCGTKAAVKLINDGLREDLLGTPIRVSDVGAGMVETEFSDVRFRGDKGRAEKVYQDITPLTADDMADAIVWATTRPAHVNVAHLLLTTIDQANSLMFYRRTP